MPMIALDIGHGSDTFQRTGGKGVKRNGKVYEEHEFNSDIAMRLQPILERHGFSVWLPQPPNSKEVDLTTRTDAANRRGVDLYWSDHANAGGASGVCAFYWGTSDEGKKLAELFAKRMKEAGFETHGNGTHAGERGSWTNMHVTRETNMTAVLTENGFMDDNGDFQGIFGSDKESYRQRVAETHAKILCEYFDIPYKDVKSETDKGDEIMKPTGVLNGTFGDYLKNASDRGIIEQSTADEYKNGEMTESNAIALVALIQTAAPGTDVAPVHQPAWEKAQEEGVFNGERPNDPITRVETATVLKRTGAFE
ncbi:N-acetylmuramoyl-L-alanine amidase family protein [Salibacterium halotolerans]|uniref:N-acetylmuramoyl-L-alanine amidase n=1 Tax=Salibacterium halotolerans TaxID=1884432 RepID=A0A1I5MQJ6_9BACI|nr:N-acetylmuramoyl-L-alanine amidase [Salibacterium halotolerans]SFP11904.1 N-acetylmuramoyl-L-alanine amidase [Salibacterium halotolerans]